MCNLYFVLIAIVGMYLGRRTGWFISKLILYNENVSNLVVGIMSLLQFYILIKKTLDKFNPV
jgi:hypothetical protein